MASVTGTTLDTYFTQLISNLMVIERQPLQRVTAQRDEINVRRGAYSDVTGYLRELQGLAKKLTSASPEYALATARQATVTATTSGTTVLTASASSLAQAGTYDLSVTQLATRHVARSNQQATADQALGLSGTLRLGGAAARQVSDAVTAATPVSGFAVSSVEAGHTELGDSTYYVETRQESGVWQFRVVNAEGRAQSVRQAGGTSYTSGWQTALTEAGSYDTGRGLTITFSGAPTQAQNWQTGAASVKYQAQGAAIIVSATDSLNTLASAINNAAYADGNGVTASVVDRQLVLTAAHTGASYKVRAQDATGTVLTSLGVLAGGVLAHETLGKNASFGVNGITVTRSTNTGLDDVITGVTLNLSADAEGRAAKLAVSNDTSPARAAIDAFVAKFNSVQTYLQAKTSIREDKTGDTTTYTRGSLARDSVFNDMRTELFSRFMSSSPNAGRYQSLRAIGLSINDSLQASVSDAALLESALKDNPTEVAQLLDQALGDLDTYLNRFTLVNTGYLDQAVKTLTSSIDEANADITAENARLTTKEASLVTQFSAVQAQLLSLTYMQQQWQAIYNSYG